MSVPLIIVGLGPVGTGVLEGALEDARFDVVACIERDAQGERLAREAGFEGLVLRDAGELADGGVAVLCTSSDAAQIAPLARALTASGCDVVTSCEELIAPALADHDAVAVIDEAANENDRTVIATGVNPGFVMDVLPALATLPVRAVEEVRVMRRVNVANRRDRLQQKVGMGIALEEFERRREQDAIGHVGLRASLAYLAAALGITGESEERVEPVVDWDGTHSRGVRHVATVVDDDDRVRVRGLLEMYAGATEVDRVEIDATPPLTLEIAPGLFGDTATISALLNAAGSVREMPAGLRTLADVRPPLWQEAKGGV